MSEYEKAKWLTKIGKNIIDELPENISVTDSIYLFAALVKFLTNCMVKFTKLEPLDDYDRHGIF